MTSIPTVTQQLDAAVQQNTALSRTGLLERMFSRLFHGLVYAQIWEDPVVDMQALALGPTDNVICIASGGCNMLSYLTASPATVTAVDLSPAHVMLNKVKLAAVRNVPDHATLYALLGTAKGRENIATFDQHVAPHLDAETRTYWNAWRLRGPRKMMFARGLYRQGLLGRFIGTLHLVTWLARVDFKPLLRAQSLAEQQSFFDSQIAPLYDTKLIRFLARRRASLFGLGIPPAQYDKLAADADGDIVAVLRERTRKLFCDFPIQDNYFAWQAANRAYATGPDAAVPPYLEARHFETVRANADRVQVLNKSLVDVLAERPAASQQAYVLLDAQDWMNDDQLNALWLQISRTATPGARVIFRTGGTADILPGRVLDDILRHWRYQPEASATGLRNDRSAIYGGFHLYEFMG